jgi:hypothetical protein
MAMTSALRGRGEGVRTRRSRRIETGIKDCSDSGGTKRLGCVHNEVTEFLAEGGITRAEAGAEGGNNGGDSNENQLLK